MFQFIFFIFDLQRMVDCLCFSFVLTETNLERVLRLCLLMCKRSKMFCCFLIFQCSIKLENRLLKEEVLVTNQMRPLTKRDQPYILSLHHQFPK
jgi:hypothetical protein